MQPRGRPIELRYRPWLTVCDALADPCSREEVRDGVGHRGGGRVVSLVMGIDHGQRPRKPASQPRTETIFPGHGTTVRAGAHWVCATTRGVRCARSCSKRSRRLR